MKRLMSAVAATVLLASVSAWAGDGHGYGYGYGYGKHESKYAEKAWKKERKAWEKQQKHWVQHGHYQHAYAVAPHYYPAPAVVQSYPAPVHFPAQPRLQVVLSLPLN